MLCELKGQAPVKKADVELDLSLMHLSLIVIFAMASRRWKCIRKSADELADVDDIEDEMLIVTVTCRRVSHLFLATRMGFRN